MRTHARCASSLTPADENALPEGGDYQRCPMLPVDDKYLRCCTDHVPVIYRALLVEWGEPPGRLDRRYTACVDYGAIAGGRQAGRLPVVPVSPPSPGVVTSHYAGRGMKRPQAGNRRSSRHRAAGSPAAWRVQLPTLRSLWLLAVLPRYEGPRKQKALVRARTRELDRLVRWGPSTISGDSAVLAAHSPTGPTAAINHCDRSRPNGSH